MYVLMLRDSHDDALHVSDFISRLVSLGVSRSDIFWDSAVGGYLFLDCAAGVMSGVWAVIHSDSAIDSNFSYQFITREEFDGMHSCLPSCIAVGYGDIVYIVRGRYDKLYGIVLRSYFAGRYTIGLKFCQGVSYVQLCSGDFSVVGNIFDIVKVPL